MGLDKLPSERPSHKQWKNCSQNYVQGKIFVDKPRKREKLDSRSSSRKNSLEHQEFKDVFEVQETPKMQRRVSSSHPIHGNTSMRPTEADLKFIQQKFVDAKRLSTETECQNSKEFHDTLEVQDSNNNLLLKFLRHPDPLFSKHLKNLHGSIHESHCGHVAALKSSDILKCQSRCLDSWKLEKETPHSHGGNPSEKDSNGLSSERHCKHVAQSYSSMIRLGRKDETSLFRTRIVVLKPNIGKAQGASHEDPFVCSNPQEISGVKQREAASGGQKNFTEDVRILRQKTRESREIAKEITRQMRKNFVGSPITLSSYATKDCVGYESLSSMPGNESANEAETTRTSRDSSSGNTGNRFSSLHSIKSSVSREAKKRLSERWKKARKTAEPREASRGSTLGEMLAIHVRQLKQEKFGPLMSENGFNGSSAQDDGPVQWVEPIGISSQDGWKEGSTNNLPRLRSIPASFSVCQGPETCICHETISDESFMMLKEVLNGDRKKTDKSQIDLRKSSNSNNKCSRCKKSQSVFCPGQENCKNLVELHVSQNGVESFKKEGYPSDENINVLGTSQSDTNDILPSPKKFSDVVYENSTISSHFDQEIPVDKLAKGNHSPGGLNMLKSQVLPNTKSGQDSGPLQQPVAELGSPHSSKEAEQPSPVSILEAPFVDDISAGSECFGSLSADLQGLRLQLQLLKMESEAYGEGSIFVSSDEDAVEESLGIPEDKGIHESVASRESSYMIDVLEDSGFCNADPDTFIALWHSPDCPVDPLIFAELEKKYKDCTSWSRCERKLLFDRINLGILNIYRQFSDPHPWVGKPATGTGHQSIGNGLKDSLCQALRSEEKKRKDAPGKMLATDSQWLDLSDEMDVIRREIERLLINDLVGEIAAA